MSEYESEVNCLEVDSVLGKAGISLPQRSDDMPSGSAIGKSLLYSAGQQRDNAFIDQILSGNIPDVSRSFATVTVMAGGNTIQYWVSRDVLSVGSNSDYLRISLNGKSAKLLCDKLFCMMPTKKMCDDIWRMADLRLNPKPMGASSSMTNTQTLINHNIAINDQVAGREFALLTGHKKDVVIDKNLLTYKNNIGIYGWFYKSGQPIQGPQPNCTSHSIDYQDYSSGIRLVSQNVLINNKLANIFDILNNENTYLISEQGRYDARKIYM